MAWQKTGLLIEPPVHLSWSASHAAVPSVDLADEATFVYFTTRDQSGRSNIARTRFDASALSIGAIESTPILSPGPLGGFDDSGAMAGCVVRDDYGRIFLYYVGWQLGVTVPFYTYIGLAISGDGGETFVRAQSTPVLERSPIDPYMAHSPWVIRDNGVWRMWYSSGTHWEQRDDEKRHYYHIKYAESEDGISWRRAGHVCIDYANSEEYAVARACVVKDDDRYRMWFAHRGNAYRIGYAESADGLAWDRQDSRAGIDRADSGWDSGMVAYPCVFDAGGRRHMLYNGNGYGATGIGHAVVGGEPES